MIAGQPSTKRTPERIEQFIRAFFGPGNTIWSDQDPDSPAGRRLRPYLQVLHAPGSMPVVLPRMPPAPNIPSIAYVIAHDRAHATSVAELLTAFVGPSFSTFNGRPAQLDATGDPVERAVLEFAGQEVTFTLTGPNPQVVAKIWEALDLMQATLARRPARAWHTPRPVGRLLAEFDVALAAGDNSASSDILGYLTAHGRLSASNLAHLRIKRLARLGRDIELLNLPDLADVLLADPPTPVADSVLTALYTAILAEHMAAGDLFSARESLLEHGRVVPLLLGRGATGLSGQAITVLVFAAFVLSDFEALDDLLSHEANRDCVDALFPELLAEVDRTISPTLQAAAGPSIESLSVEGSSQVLASEEMPHSWPELIWSIADDRGGSTAILRGDLWQEWSPPVSADAEIAEILAGLNDSAAQRVWSIVGAFVDADGCQLPAARSAHELVRNALTFGRFTAGDLAGLVALTEIVLRAALDQREYTVLLDDLRAESDRWVSPERATVALDLADLLVRAACPDQEARLRLATGLLQPLHAHDRRLDPDQAAFAAQLSAELHTGLIWPSLAEEDADAGLTDLPSLTVLLYSLDEGALARTASALGRLAPRVKIRLSHDHVGGPPLKHHARNADVVVMATRCATHAATGFIRANAGPHTVVREADGSGSASLLRAAVVGLMAHTSEGR